MISGYIQTWAIIVGAGSGSRMGEATGGIPKQFVPYLGRPLYWHSAMAFGRSACVDGLVFVFPEDACAREAEKLATLAKMDNLGLMYKIVAGGQTRCESVSNGLRCVPLTAERIFVHDAARPFASPDLIMRIIDAMDNDCNCVIPVLPLTDTIKLMTESGNRIEKTLPRQRLVATQTPQLFRGCALRKAHALSAKDVHAATDDAMLLEKMGVAIKTVPGEGENIKITGPEDLKKLAETSWTSSVPLTGFGYDVHRFGGNRPLKLGGVSIPGDFFVMAHSDGDVLLHALMDALLGCASLGDIGDIFPDSDPAYDGMSSTVLLDEVLSRIDEAGVRICHADLTIIAQKPKIAPYKQEIRKNVARLLDLPIQAVNIKATTEEGLGFTGKMEGIKAYALVTSQVFTAVKT